MDYKSYTGPCKWQDLINITRNIIYAESEILKVKSISLFRCAEFQTLKHTKIYLNDGDYLYLSNENVDYYYSSDIKQKLYLNNGNVDYYSSNNIKQTLHFSFYDAIMEYLNDNPQLFIENLLVKSSTKK